MKPSEVRDLSSAEIDTQIKKAREKLFKFRFHASNEDMQRAGEIKQLRRSVARFKTELRRRELEAGKATNSDAAKEATNA